MLRHQANYTGEKIMRPLPEKGLIVSCYLESMKGSEKAFIASVAHHPKVVALRVEGLDNIRYARLIAPEKYIIGLVKRYNVVSGINDITSELLIDGQMIIASGADMVASSHFYSWANTAGAYTITIAGFNLPFALMYDADILGIETLYSKTTRLFENWQRSVVHKEMRENNFVVATTFKSKGFELVEMLREKFGSICKINLEGGIETAEEIQRGFDCGADWVTIGKAINDPVTIIDNLMRVI